MKILITGICGFVGNQLALELQHLVEGIQIVGIDNLSRPGSELNRSLFRQKGIACHHADIRNPSDLEGLPKIDWVIDAAANPSVLAGVSGTASSRQLMEHNLVGTINVLEFCRRTGAGMLMLSTSRVYSLNALCALPMEVAGRAFKPRFSDINHPGFSVRGVAEEFSAQPPLSLYGSAKLASELVALEYGATFNLPVFVNRCGVLGGAGQFGKADQGIFAFWIHSFRWKSPLKYIGFNGTGHQVRDCLHPRDLARLLAAQISQPQKAGSVCNVSGGISNSISLAQLTQWCEERFGSFHVAADPSPRRFDVPWLVLDSARAQALWSWTPTIGLSSILDEIARHAEQHPDWLELSRDA